MSPSYATPAMSAVVEQIIPATGWFARFGDSAENSDDDIYEPLVAWAIKSDGEVIGLIQDHDQIVNAVNWARVVELEWGGFTHARDTPEGLRRRRYLNEYGRKDDAAVASHTVLELVTDESGDDGAA